MQEYSTSSYTPDYSTSSYTPDAGTIADTGSNAPAGAEGGKPGSPVGAYPGGTSPPGDATKPPPGGSRNDPLGLLSGLLPDPAIQKGYLGVTQDWYKYLIGSYMPAQQQLAQQVEQLQAQIAQAQATGDWNGVQTLAAKLQEAQIQQQQVQNQMQQQLQNAQIGMGTGELTGMVGNQPTVQLQNLMNQYAMGVGQQNLDYLNTLGQYNLGQESLQNQMAQSPLVAWYTARGLPPPNSAFVQGQALPQFQAPTPTWSTQPNKGIPGFTDTGQQPLQMPQNAQDLFNKATQLGQQAVKQSGGGGFTQQQAEGVYGQLGLPQQVADALFRAGQQYVHGGGGQTAHNRAPDEATWAGMLQNAINQYNQNIPPPSQVQINTPNPGGYGPQRSVLTQPANARSGMQLFGQPGNTPQIGAAMMPGAPSSIPPPPTMPQGPASPGGIPGGSSPFQLSPNGGGPPMGVVSPAMTAGANTTGMGTGLSAMGQAGGGPPMMAQNANPGAPSMQSGVPTNVPMSTGAPPWAQALTSGNRLPSFVGMGSANPLPSSQVWNSLNPAEQQAVMQLAQSTAGMNPQMFMQQMGAQAPEWGAVGPATYGAS